MLVTVPTIDGSDAKVKVPEGTQSGKQFRLKGKGMFVLRSRDTGDLYIQVVVETPQKPRSARRELLMGVRCGVLKGNSSGEFRVFLARSGVLRRLRWIQLA